MPVIVKNGRTYGDRSVTLTQAEYNALSETEKNNGTCYYIYDANAMIQADNIGLDGGTVEDLAGSVATFESSPSTAVHAAGEYILYQAQLYKVTSAIAVGEDLTVGTNIEATNVGNELSAGFIQDYEYVTSSYGMDVYYKHIGTLNLLLVRGSTSGKVGSTGHSWSIEGFNISVPVPFTTIKSAVHVNGTNNGAYYVQYGTDARITVQPCRGSSELPSGADVRVVLVW